MLDLNGNGVSDVWELIYGVDGIDLSLDSDGDGVPNWLEALAGTDPFDARSVPKIATCEVTPSGVRITASSILGKLYRLQSSEAYPDVTSWQAEDMVVARTNGTVILWAPADRPAKFFRLAVADVDTDGDGLSDWEEYQLGLDPLVATSNGQVDAAGRPLTDLQYIRRRLSNTTLASLLAGSGAGMVRRTRGAAISASPPLAPIAAASLPSGTGLTGQYYTNSSSTYSNPINFNPTNLFLTTNDPVIDYRWGPALPINLSNAMCTVRWTGQIEPQYSETYVFETRTDDGVKLWVNDQLLIDQWRLQGSTSWTNAISLQAGVRYNIRIDYFNGGGSARASFYWYSASQPRQIVPGLRLYPSSDGSLPGAVTSPLKAFAFLGQPFLYTLTGANTPIGFGATNLPPGLGLNSTNGVISGIPALAGSYAVGLSVTNAVGDSSALLDLEVLDTGSAVTREVWLGVPGTSVTNIPLHLPASLTNSLGTLEGITNFGDNYSERVRGYLTAPVTGNYYFWLAANSAAELWIANDGEPMNKVRRAFVTKGTLPRQWNLQPNQRSAWLSLQAGQRYYLEILHQAGKGANDHWSVAWLQDPTGTNTVPAGVVPGYVLSPYVETPISSIPGTLYSANLVAQSGALSSGVGTSTLRVSADGTQAILKFTYSGLSSPLAGMHIHSDPYLSHPSQILFDIDDAVPQGDGSYIWDIVPVGTLSAAEILEILREGKSYINLHTDNYPNGEINGHFALAAGTPVFIPPPPPPAWVDDHASSNAVARFLQQATFGPSPADLKAVHSMGYERWIKKQFKLKVSGHLTNVMAMVNADPNAGFSGTYTFNTWWQQSVSAPDQLRQRVAFALSQILVVSESGVLSDNPRALSAYYDVLLTHAFGNFRDLLRAVTLSPAMGEYLDMRRNDKGNLAQGTHPNENYAREILQLFSVGLNRMWPDGTLVLNTQGDLVPTYDQDVIIGFARVFTGWNYYQTNQANKRLPTNWNPDDDSIRPMVLVPTHHELGTKRLLDNAILPPAQGAQADSTKTNFDGYCSRDLELGLDAIFQNQNVGPFICRQLIQRLVTSHPTRDYLFRVVQKFNDNGEGVRGDMQAVIKAILLDYEARSPFMLAAPSFGKQREPLLRATAMARAFPAPAPLKGSYHQNGTSVTITTHKPHRLSSSDDVFLNFSGKAGPASQIYNNVTVNNANTLTITAQGVTVGTYSQAGTIITVTNSGHGLAVGQQLYLDFTSGGAPDHSYTVDTVVSSSVFTVTNALPAVRAGTCAFSKWRSGGVEQSGFTVTLSTTGPHGLKVGDSVYVDFPSGMPSPDGVYRVATVPNAMLFTVVSAVSGDWSDSDPLILPLVPPPLTRSGSVTIRYNTWNMDYTDSGSSSSLSQTPLNSPTVFNYFFPDYKFQGILASAGLTTPEFQLTSDTSVVLQMNFLAGGVFNNGANTNGLSSFTGGNGSITMDVGAWMTPALTSDAGVPGLVDALNTVLCAGQLSPQAKAIIVNYVANPRYPYTIPTATQMRDRVRAVVHLIATSPDFTIQR